MNEFNYEENFAPSRTTKDWWLWTHKSPQKISGVSVPGLFQTTHYEWQLIGFFSIFLLEGIATFWSFTFGVAITAILVSIFVDVVLAIVAHIWHKEICRLKNENVFTEGERNTANGQKISRLKLVTYFFYLLILGSAGFKCFWFFSVYSIGHIFDSTALFIFVCYALGAILHITCTGYAFYTLIFKIKIRGEHNAYINSDGAEHSFNVTTPLKGLIETKMQLHPTEVGRHKIVKEDDGKFYFHTFGILTDKELRQFIGRQIEREQKRTVASEGVKHQYTIWGE